MNFLLDEVKIRPSCVIPSKVGRYNTIVLIVDTSEEKEMESSIGSDDTEDSIRPHLRPSIFPNVPPFINFLNIHQKYIKFVNL